MKRPSIPLFTFAAVCVLAAALWLWSGGSGGPTGSLEATFQQPTGDDRDVPALAAPIPTDRAALPLVRVRGQVVDEADRPIAGAEVGCRGASVTTDPTGRFTLSVTAAATQESCIVRASGFSDHVVKLPARHSDLDLGVLHLTGGGIIHAQVREPSGKPVKGATVSWRRAKAGANSIGAVQRISTTEIDPRYGGSVITGPDGVAEIVVPRRHVLALRVRTTEGSESDHGPFDLAEAERLLVELVLPDDVALRLRLATSLPRGVTATAFLQPLDAHPFLAAARTIPMTQEPVAVRVPRGTYSLWWKASAVLLGSQSVTLERDTELVLPVPPLRSVHVRVFDDAGAPADPFEAYLRVAGPPSEGVEPSIFWVFRPGGVVGRAGEAILLLPAPEATSRPRCVVLVRAPGFKIATQRLDVAASAESIPTLEFRLLRAPRVEGTIAGAKAGTSIGLWLLSHTGSGDKWGENDAPQISVGPIGPQARFSLETCGSGTYSLRVQVGDGRWAEVGRIETGTESVVRFVGTAPPLGSLVVKPSDTRGDVPDTARTIDPATRSLRGPAIRGTRSGGVVWFESLPAGSYAVGWLPDLEEPGPPAADEDRRHWLTVEVSPGANASVTWTGDAAATEINLRLALPQLSDRSELVVATIPADGHRRHPAQLAWARVSASGTAMLTAPARPLWLVVAVLSRSVASGKYYDDQGLTPIVCRRFESLDALGRDRVAVPAPGEIFLVRTDSRIQTVAVIPNSMSDVLEWTLRKRFEDSGEGDGWHLVPSGELRVVAERFDHDIVKMVSSEQSITMPVGGRETVRMQMP